jgi:hypothetical protein
MPDIHKLLDECQSQSQALVNEIDKFKKSRILHEKTTVALETTATMLRQTLKEIKPLTEKRVRLLSIIVFSTTALNTLLFVAMTIKIYFL